MHRLFAGHPGPMCRGSLSLCYACSCRRPVVARAQWPRHRATVRAHRSWGCLRSGVWGRSRRRRWGSRSRPWSHQHRTRRACVTQRKLQTPGNAKEHKRQETPTINPIGPTNKTHRTSTKHYRRACGMSLRAWATLALGVTWPTTPCRVSTQVKTRLACQRR